MSEPTPNDCPEFRVETFGFLHSVPETSTGAVLVDLRHALRNPHHDPAMRELTGEDEAVRHHVLTTPGAVTCIQDTVGQALAVRAYNDRRNHVTNVLIGCQGGKHRSVAIGNAVTEALRDRGFRVEIEHRHMHRPVVQRSNRAAGITFDYIGECHAPAVKVVEAYTPTRIAHGSLDATVAVCAEHHQMWRGRISEIHMTPYTVQGCAPGKRCGDRTVFDPCRLTVAYEGITR